MKPLVNYCRWQSAKLRLHGRDEGAVWGELAIADGPNRPFRYNLRKRELTLSKGDDSEIILLDEMGVEVGVG